MTTDTDTVRHKETGPSTRLTKSYYPFTITGTSGSLVHSVAASLIVDAPPDFALGAAPSSQTVTAGGQTAYTVTVAGSNGFAGAVSLAASGLPDGATAGFNPTAPTASSTLTITTTASVAAGNYPFTITGVSGGLAHSVAATLVVQAAPTGPTLGVSPTSSRHGTNVTVSWSGVTSPTSSDWIGIFPPGAANSSYLSYEYDSTCRSGHISTARSSGSCSFRLPNQAGTYELRLMANNGFTSIVTGVLVTAT